MKGLEKKISEMHLGELKILKMNAHISGRQYTYCGLRVGGPDCQNDTLGRQNES